MVIRRLGVAFAALVLTGCATVEMSTADATASTSRALDRAGIPTEAVTVADSAPGAFTLTAATADGDLTLVLDAGSGRFTAVDIADGVVVSDAALDVLAHHHDNPADERARTRRSIIAVALVLAAIAGGLALARRARLREESASR